MLAMMGCLTSSSVGSKEAISSVRSTLGSFRKLALRLSSSSRLSEIDRAYQTL